MGKSKIFSQVLAQRLLHKEIDLPFPFYNNKAYMGLGVALMGQGKELTFLHNGYNSPGSVCIVIGFPELGKGAVIAANGANGEKLYLEILATLAEKYHWPIGQLANSIKNKTLEFLQNLSKSPIIGHIA